MQYKGRKKDCYILETCLVVCRGGKKGKKGEEKDMKYKGGKGDHCIQLNIERRCGV